MPTSRPVPDAGVTDPASTVDVVLPCLDEADALPWVLGRMPAFARPVVVDNGSRDGSAEVAQALGALVVTAPVRGYGAACHAGLEAATADLVAVMDADASLDPGELERLLTAHRAGADLVVGRRRAVPRSWPWHLRLANRVLASRLRRRTGLRLDDVGPMRLAGRRALLDLGVVDRRSGYPLETVVRAADAGWRVAQVDVTYRPRVGRSKVTGTPLGAARAVRDMSRVLDA
ncbi:glycosyltransferase family 2 protein [Lapillicoccus jejuensis]|uniref:Glycosyl transferase family 2 n=1 Tax=Lapillicoccus jejuensis TaxID=402171 RepID=A0A542E2C1_9MICO|nr:glycosyltransferase family 2 protein [Lapillicoccus jejuensis]TQJ09492.1 glycosyl transferase family 2 [Lapillicoccus jejuensis]